MLSELCVKVHILSHYVTHPNISPQLTEFSQWVKNYRVNHKSDFSFIKGRTITCPCDYWTWSHRFIYTRTYLSVHVVSIWHTKSGLVTWRLSGTRSPVLPVWRGVWSQVTHLAQMLVDVLPDVCGEWCCLDLWAGRTCRSSLSQSPWDHHTFNWTGSANQREVSWSLCL